MVRIKCTREDCGYEWDYGGESKFYAACPRCRRQLSITKCAVNHNNDDDDKGKE